MSPLARCSRRGCTHLQDLHDAGRGPCGIQWCPCLSYHPEGGKPGMYENVTELGGKLIGLLILAILVVLAIWGLIAVWGLLRA